MKEETSRRMSIITRTELDDKNLVKAINTKAVPVAAYRMNFCIFTQSELTELDQVIKRDLRTTGKQWTIVHERKNGARRLKSLRQVYEETRLRVGCYVFVSDNRWIKEAGKQETI